MGFTIKGPTGAELGAIIISYKGSLLADQEKNEIAALYKRMGFAIIISFIFSFLIGYKTTNSLVRTVNAVLVSGEKLRKGDNNFDLSGIDDPILRGNFRKVVTYSSKLTQDLKKVEGLLISAEREKSHE